MIGVVGYYSPGGEIFWLWLYVTILLVTRFNGVGYYSLVGRFNGWGCRLLFPGVGI